MGLRDVRIVFLVVLQQCEAEVLFETKTRLCLFKSYKFLQYLNI